MPYARLLDVLHRTCPLPVVCAVPNSHFHYGRVRLPILTVDYYTNPLPTSPCYCVV